MDNISDKLAYLLDYLNYCITMDAYGVLSDSAKDPQYSAVATANLIKCYTDVSKAIGKQISCDTVEDYLRSICFTSDDVQLFEKKRTIEAVSYTGKQY